MFTALAVWLGIGAAVAAIAKRYLGATWRRAVLGSAAWPVYPFLIAGSRYRYTQRRRIVP